MSRFVQHLLQRLCCHSPTPEVVLSLTYSRGGAVTHLLQRRRCHSVTPEVALSPVYSRGCAVTHLLQRLCCHSPTPEAQPLPHWPRIGQPLGGPAGDAHGRGLLKACVGPPLGSCRGGWAGQRRGQPSAGTALRVGAAGRAGGGPGGECGLARRKGRVLRKDSTAPGKGTPRGHVTCAP